VLKSQKSAPTPIIHHQSFITNHPVFPDPMLDPTTIPAALRSITARSFRHEGQPYVMLVDPSALTDTQLMVPHRLALALNFMDGELSLAAICAAYEAEFAHPIEPALVGDLVIHLSDAGFLYDATFAEVQARVLAEYRALPYRPSSHAGAAYPGEAPALTTLLQAYCDAAGPIEPAPVDWSSPVGLLSPHIDYARGHAVYAAIWRRAAQAVREAELVILLGTDHRGNDRFSLTRQHYATPLGVMPTDLAPVDRLATVIGEKRAFAGELRHRQEHSLELPLVWLQFLRGGEPVPIVPILTGSLHDYLETEQAPAKTPAIAQVLATLRQLAQGRRTLVIASGDLAHVGPAFAGAPLRAAGKARITQADNRLLAALETGEADRFFGEIRSVQDRHNVCGVAPLYYMLHLVGPCTGEQSGYAVCPADRKGTSIVTVAGMLFQGRR
jgi:AmmeMemoRadiSam system protein B